MWLAIASVLFKDIGALINVAFNYAPAGIEIMKPDKEVSIKTSELQSIILDLSKVAMEYSQFILSRVLSKEDFEKAKTDLQNREMIGKKLLEKKD